MGILWRFSDFLMGLLQKLRQKFFGEIFVMEIFLYGTFENRLFQENIQQQRKYKENSQARIKMQQNNTTQSVNQLTINNPSPNAQPVSEYSPSNPNNCSLTAQPQETFIPRKRTISIPKPLQIKVQECQRNSGKNGGVKECRICLEGEDQGRMIRPCLCFGSVTFVHEKCIIEWIKRKHQPKNSKAKLLCEMCNTPFVYKFGKRRKLDLQYFCLNYQKEKCNFILFYMFTTLLLLVIIGLIFIIGQSGSSSQLGSKIKQILVKSQNIKIIYICVIFLLSIVLMFLLILFIIEYGVKSQLSISEVMSYSEAGVKKKSKIHPIERVIEDTSGYGRLRVEGSE